MIDKVKLFVLNKLIQLLHWLKMKEYISSVANIEVKCLDKGCGEVGKIGRGGPKFPFFNWLFSYYACQFCGSKKIEVVPPEVISYDDPQAENLRMLYSQINNEITRYRDYEWKIVVLSIALSWGVFLAAKTQVRAMLSGKLLWVADIVMIFVIVIGTVLLSAHLLFVHGELTTNRNWRERIRRILGIYEEPSVFPPAWKGYIAQYKNGRDTFVIPFLLFMYITGLGLAYVLSLQHPVPEFVVKKGGSIVVAIWCWWLPSFLFLLIGVEICYVIRAVLVQGLGRRSSY